MTGPVDLLDVVPAADEENELLILDREEVLRRVEGNLEGSSKNRLLLAT